jgi:hypothetical protein
VPITRVGIARTKAFVLNRATPAPSTRHRRRIAAYPLRAPWRLHYRPRGIAPQATMFTSHGLGFPPIGSHHLPLSRGVELGRRPPRSVCRGIPQMSALSSWVIFL